MRTTVGDLRNETLYAPAVCRNCLIYSRQNWALSIVIVHAKMYYGLNCCPDEELEIRNRNFPKRASEARASSSDPGRKVRHKYTVPFFSAWSVCSLNMILCLSQQQYKL
jgi:hypothetical protein